MDRENKKVSFHEAAAPLPGDEKLLVVINHGASENKRQRKRSRAVSNVSLESDGGDKEEEQSLVPTESFVSMLQVLLQKLALYFGARWSRS